MVMKTTRPTDTLGLVGIVDPISLNGSSSSDWFAMKDFQSYMAIISAGASPNALNAKIEQATDASGTDAKDVDGKAITALNGAGAANDQAVIEFCAEDLDVDNDFTHCRLTLTTGGASVISGHVIGCDVRMGKGSTKDLASVVEIIGLDA